MFSAFRANAVKCHRVIHQLIAVFRCNFGLAFFDFFIDKFDDLAAHHANQMIMVVSVVQLKNCCAVFKISACQNPGRSKMGQDAVNRG